MSAPNFTCPAGHVADVNEYGTPECHQCDLVATHYNARDGEVYTWTPRATHEAACERLRDQMDAAFDNQYFSEW